MKKGYKIKLVIILMLVITLNLSSNVVKALNLDNTKENFVICIDPGHQEKGDPKGEPIAPGASQKKPRVSSGTAGVGTKKPEYVVNLEASQKLKTLLENKGYKVVMTRETHDVNISNVERAQFANDKNANLVIRIHCDGINDSGKTGASILIPSKTGKHTTAIYEESNVYGNIMKKHLEECGIKVNGVFERGDMTGFNWSKVPVVILEMGFMSNWNEDKMLCDENYQQKLMESVANSVDEYRVKCNADKNIE